MSWPIGYGKQDVSYRTRADGTVTANGVEVTAAGGWIQLPTRAGAVSMGAPARIAVQLRPRLDIRGRTYLYLGGVRVAGVEYDGAHAMQAAWVPIWLGSLAEVLHAEIADGVASGERQARASGGPVERPSGRYAVGMTPPSGVDVAALRRRRSTGSS